jgi:transposase
MIAKGVKLKQVARGLGISESTVYRTKRRIKECGDVEGPKKKTGRKPLLPPGIQDVFSSVFFYTN